jgi:hypothetical protein
MNTLFPINKISLLKISCPASKSAATVLNHHDMGYTYESDAFQVAFQEPEPMPDVNDKTSRS